MAACIRQKSRLRRNRKDRVMIAVGCLVQWFEIEMIEEYLNSLTKSIGVDKDKVLIDLILCTNQDLEVIEDISLLPYIENKFKTICEKVEHNNFIISYSIRSDLYTIADYRREFNERYCTVVDVLFWGESDMLVPSQAIQTILSLHNFVKESSTKWLGFFATCKMWDDSWKILEHPKLTDLPRDPHKWYGTRSYMDYSKMEEINSDVNTPDVISTFNYKFNGCGLVISSELVKSGANIPRSVFFTHEDTAFMNLITSLFGNQQIPFYIIKNILLVHNREHSKKRMYIRNEKGKDLGEKRNSNTWYRLASEYSKFNSYNFMKQEKMYSWKDVWNHR